MSDLNLISGVYAIRNILDGKLYIGSAVSLSYRRYEHFRKLSRNGHSNPHLQAAWNKYWGECSFQFLIIEYCEPIREKLLEREQFWIDATQCFTKGYNRNPIAGSKLGSPVSVETRLKMSLSAKKKIVTDEHKKNIGLARKGKKLAPETIQKMVASRQAKGRTYVGLRIKYPCPEGMKCKCEKCRASKAAYAREWRANVKR